MEEDNLVKQITRSDVMYYTRGNTMKMMDGQCEETVTCKKDIGGARNCDWV